MPRGLRLDAPGTLHHIMLQGIERTTIFRDDTDWAAFVARLAAWGERGALTVDAWALLPNHAHLLVRTGSRPPRLPLATVVTRARDGIAHLWVRKLGQSGRRLAPVLGIAPQSVYRAAARGGTRAAEWARLLAR